MDLQAILDSADSSSEDSYSGGNRGKASPSRGYVDRSLGYGSYNNNNNNVGSGGGSEDAVDLERILREDDDYDEDDGV